MFISVITASRSRGIGNGLTYECDEAVSVGSLVKVPLRNEVIEGIVIETNLKRPDMDTKHIHSVLSKEEIIPKHLIDLAKWISEYYMCSLRHVFQVLIPAPPWTALLPESITVVELMNRSFEGNGKKQKIVIEALLSGPIELNTLRNETGVSLATLKTLQKKGIVRFSQEYAEKKPQRPQIKGKMHAELKKLFSEKKPTLLFEKSVTGRETIIANLIEHTLAMKKSILILSPDILSAVQQRRSLVKILPDVQSILLHGSMSPQEERRAFRLMRENDTHVVIGTRTALFSAIHDLGAVVVLDEHEWTYKNEQMPRYHARNTAERLSKLTGSKCVFLSPTPSLEIYAKTVGSKAEINHATLTGKHLSNRIDIVDLSATSFGTMYPFSPELLDAIQSQLSKKKQSVLFLNHRGIATTILCKECKKRIVSKNTGLPLTVHDVKGKMYLIDHQNDEHHALPSACPSCGSVELIKIGAGTQGVESLLRKVFLTARIERVDRNTLEKHNTLENILERTASGHNDILIGTSPVLKSLHLPNVTFAAALIADIGMSLPDFRASEESFQTLFSIARAMRGKSGGRAIIQTFKPDAPEIQSVVNDDPESFLKNELTIRKKFRYPPETQMIALIFRGPKAQEEAKKTYSTLSNDQSVISSCFASLFEPDTWFILLRGEDPRTALQRIQNTNGIIDVDPLTVL